MTISKQPILIVENNPVTSVLQHFFIQAGCTVHLVAKKDSVLKQINKVQYGIIFMDIDLVDAKGNLLVQQIRTQPSKNQTTPIVGFNACL